MGSGSVDGRRVVGSTHHAEDGAELVEHVAGAEADLRERGLGAVGVVAQEVVGDARLHVDHGDVVGDHVVELAGDPQALLGDLAAGLLLERLLRASARSWSAAARSSTATT